MYSIFVSQMELRIYMPKYSPVNRMGKNSPLKETILTFIKQYSNIYTWRRFLKPLNSEKLIWLQLLLFQTRKEVKPKHNCNGRNTHWIYSEERKSAIESFWTMSERREWGKFLSPRINEERGIGGWYITSQQRPLSSSTVSNANYPTTQLVLNLITMHNCSSKHTIASR